MGKNIVLVGLMGAGKTTVGECLAEKYKLIFTDSDEVIERDTKMSISQIFAERGEAYFRELEKTAISMLSSKNGRVISTGGGALENEENIENLKKNGVLVYLKASPEILYKRIKKQNHRPLLQNEKPLETLRILLQQREKNYLKADIIIETDDKTIEKIVDEIGELCKL